MTTTNFTARHRAMLRAIADGRGQIVVARVPNLSVDGLWCDFSATNDLVGNGLVRPALSAPTGSLAPAVLTATGVRTLAALSG
ncbi:hypothetical protein [Actinophytocola sp. NPDC049390]|uniref:hypothetical protein n=1 Tax=Actinophytocola sp. NPDC049390 TaxID=3363894 RepID=UPI0037AA0060